MSRDYESGGYLIRADHLAALRAGRVPPVADELLPSEPVSHSPRRALPVQPNNGIIYAIVDLKADAIIGGLQLHRADAAAIRAFGDIASNPETIVSKHPEDYELRRLGWLTLENEIEQSILECVISGAQWKAAQSLKLTED